MPASNVHSHTISVAINHVDAPLILKPSDNTLVIINPTKVVTSATPPLKAGILSLAILVISGSKINSTKVNIQTAAIKAIPDIEKPLRMTEARNKPTALANSFSTTDIKNRIITNTSFFVTIGIIAQLSHHNTCASMQ